MYVKRRRKREEVEDEEMQGNRKRYGDWRSHFLKDSNKNEQCTKSRIKSNKKRAIC